MTGGEPWRRRDAEVAQGLSAEGSGIGGLRLQDSCKTPALLDSRKLRVVAHPLPVSGASPQTCAPRGPARRVHDCPKHASGLRTRRALPTVTPPPASRGANSSSPGRPAQGPGGGTLPWGARLHGPSAGDNGLLLHPPDSVAPQEGQSWASSRRAPVPALSVGSRGPTSLMTSE